MGWEKSRSNLQRVFNSERFALHIEKQYQRLVNVPPKVLTPPAIRLSKFCTPFYLVLLSTSGTTLTHPGHRHKKRHLLSVCNQLTPVGWLFMLSDPIISCNMQIHSLAANSKLWHKQVCFISMIWLTKITFLCGRRWASSQPYCGSLRFLTQILTWSVPLCLLSAFRSCCLQLFYTGGYYSCSRKCPWSLCCHQPQENSWQNQITSSHAHSQGYCSIQSSGWCGHWDF